MTASNYEDAPEELGLRHTVGAELRLHREERGLEIRDVVDAVRIQARYLEALEDGRVEDLPGTVYALGFVRTYAEFLGLDGSEMVARFKEEARGLRHQEYVLPEPIDEGKVPTAAIIIVAILLAGAAYGAYHFLYGYDRDLAQEVPDVPERLAVLLPPEEETPPGQGAERIMPGDGQPEISDAPPPPTIAQPQAEALPPPDAEQPAAEQPVGEQVATVEPSPGTAPPASTPAPPPPPAGETEPATGGSQQTGAAQPQAPPPRPEETAAATATGSPALTPESPPPAPSQASQVPGAEGAVPDSPPSPPVDVAAREPRVFGADNVDARVVITAKEDAWVEVTDPEGALLFSRVLRRGDSYRVPERPGAVFVTGNAGGLEILVDGEAAPAIGPAGMVRRNVRLNPEQLKAGTAWP